MMNLPTCKLTVLVHIPLCIFIIGFHAVLNVTAFDLPETPMPAIPQSEVCKDEYWASDIHIQLALRVAEILKVVLIHHVPKAFFTEGRVFFMKIIIPVIEIKIDVRPDDVFLLGHYIIPPMPLSIRL